MRRKQSDVHSSRDKTRMDNTTETGEPTENNTKTYVRVTSIVLYCVITLVGTVGNGLVIYVTGFRMKRTVNSLWFLNLAVADFLYTLFLVLMTVSLARGHVWPFGNIMCKINNFVVGLNIFASVFFLVVISLDRFLSVCVVVWAKNKRTVSRAKLVCLFTWIAATICSSPYTYYKQVLDYDGDLICVFPFDEYPAWSLGMFRFTAGFLIPFVIIFFSYVAIYCRLQQMQRTRKRRSNRIIISVILAFFICWFPQHIVQLIEITEEPSESLHLVGALAYGLSSLNSCLNPILYVFMCEDFQGKIKESICLVLETALAEDHMSFTSSRRHSSRLQNTLKVSEGESPGATETMLT